LITDFCEGFCGIPPDPGIAVVESFKKSINGFSAAYGSQGINCSYSGSESSSTSIPRRASIAFSALRVPRE